MIIILTNRNEYLPKKFQTSDFPMIINGIKTLENLEITREILKNDDLYNTYIVQFTKDLNSYTNSIIVLNDEFPLSELDTKYKLIKIKNTIDKKNLEDLINEDLNN